MTTPPRKRLIDEVSALVRSKRATLEISQQALAEQAQISYRRISNMERGVGDLTLSELERIAIVLEVSIYELLPSPPGIANWPEVVATYRRLSTHPAAVAGALKLTQGIMEMTKEGSAG